MKFKKTCAAVLSVTMLGAMFTGCGKEDVKSPDTGDINVAQEETTDLIWYNIGTPQEDTELVMDELNKYLKDKINVNVDLKMVDWGEYNNKMNVVVNSGDIYDIGFTSSWANNYQTNAQKGAFVELTDLLEEYGQGILDTLNPAFFEGIKVNGGIYAIPANKELGWQDHFVFNQTFVDKYNFDIHSVKSIADLEPLLKAIQENEPDVLPFVFHKNAALQPGNTPELDYVISNRLPFAVRIDDPDTIVNAFEQPELLGIYDTMRDFYQKGYLRTDAATSTDISYRTTGKWGVTIATYQPYAEKATWPLVYNAPIVTVPANEKPFINNGTTRGSMQAISVTSESPEKAMAFLNLVNTDEYVRNTLNFGIEGTHYEKVDNNKVRTTDRRKSSYDVPAFTFGNVFLTYLFEEEPDDKWEKFEEFNNDSVKTPTLGFNFNNESVKNELSAIQNVVDEFQDPIQTGTIDPEEYVAKFIEKLNEAGYEKVREEMQRQYDLWRSSQAK